MYFYIVNPAAGGGKLDKLEARLLSELKKHDILGDWSKTTGRADIDTLTREAARRGFQTIVVVGGDGTFSEVLNDIKETDPVIGIIPIGKTNQVASLLGVKNFKNAPAVLSQRRLEEITLSKVGSRLFIHDLTVAQPHELYLRIDESYTVSGTFKKLSIERDFERANFRVRLEHEKGSVTTFMAKEIRGNESVHALVDNVEYDGPLSVCLADKIIRIIVGRERII